MSFSLEPHHGIADEIQRVADGQLALAAAHLRHVGTPRQDEAVDEASRHIKKVRALLRMVKPVFAGDYDGPDRRLRAALRLLAPVADARSVIQALDGLQADTHDLTASLAIGAVRETLLHRAGRVDRKAAVDRALQKAHRLVSLERTRIDSWTLGASGLAAIAPGLWTTARRARHAMARAIEAPTARHYRAWRHWTGTLWFQLRLVERRGGRALGADVRHLETLDACLGEYRNVILLQRILVDECPVWRGDMTRAMKTLRRYQVDLRRRAEALGKRAMGEPVRAFQARVRGGWQRAVRHAA